MSLRGMQAGREWNITLWSTAQLQTATQYAMQWVAYGGHICAWMTCLHSRTVDAATSTLSNRAWLCGVAAELAAHTTNSLVYLLSRQTVVFFQTNSIRIRFIFDNIIQPNTNTLFHLVFGANIKETEYSVQPYFSQNLSFVILHLC